MRFPSYSVTRERAASPVRRAARQCSGAGPAASQRPGPGARRRPPDHRSAPGPALGRTGHSHHSGTRPRSAGRWRPRRCTCARRTVPWPAPPGHCGTAARQPRHARAAALPRWHCRARAARARAGRRRRYHQRARAGQEADRQGGNPGRQLVLLTYVHILPSGHEPAPAGQRQLSLAPFRGVRYAEDRVSGLAEVTSPPYDVIAHDIEGQLMAADPHNVVRLILPRRVRGRPGDAYSDAARLLQAWQDEQILRSDPEPALYVYEQAATGSGGDATVIQRGLIGALRLGQPDAGDVRPHEGVPPGRVAGRRQLMEATEANLEPIFLLHDPGDPGEPGAARRLIEEAALARPPLAEAVTADGLRHRIWAITEPAELAAIAADLAPARPVIADGHHRYSAYLDLQRRRRAAGSGPGPWDYGLALLVDGRAYPPRVGAIHRVIPHLDPDAAAELAKAAFRVRALPGGDPGLPAAVSELAAASSHGVAFLVADDAAAYLLTEPDQLQVDAAMPAGRSVRWRGLAASVLQELLVGRIWGIRDSDRNVGFVHNDPAAAIRAASEAGGTAVICSPMSAADVYAVAARGELVPRKSTSFDPKPRTGLVIRTFAQS